MRNTIRINGNIVGGNMAGRNITAINNRVIVDGKDVTPDNIKEINIQVEGSIDKLEVDCGTVHVNGDVNNLRTVSGDVDVAAGITGSVQTVSGDVDCGGSISGSVSTVSGDVKSRR